MFRALALHLHGNKKLEEETSKTFNLFLNNSVEGDVSIFQGVRLNDIPKVEDSLQLNIFLYDIDFVDGELIGELCRRIFKRMKNSSSSYTTTITFATSTTSMHCSKLSGVLRVAHFTQRLGNLERHLVTCSDGVKHIYPKNVDELRETLSEMLDTFKIPYRNEQKLFMNLAIFDFESICVKEDSYKQTETTTWIGENVPISVSTSSNLFPETTFLCNANPHHLISYFITALQRFATQSKTQMTMIFFEVETAVKIKLCAILEQLNERRNRAKRV